ncbi:MAG: acylphosphatase [Candidatus Woesearchaeota archaeon]|nr:MAG: acylphosphatase [Candidatus Woesearchaeota archaeon]
MENIRIHLWIYGRVHGVFFRESLVRHAIPLGVKGFVRNIAYESCVEAVLEGPKDKVEELVKWCHEGPPQSRVDKVETLKEQYSGGYEDFRIEF